MSQSEIDSAIEEIVAFQRKVHENDKDVADTLTMAIVTW